MIIPICFSFFVLFVKMTDIFFAMNTNQAYFEKLSKGQSNGINSRGSVLIFRRLRHKSPRDIIENFQMFKTRFRNRSKTNESEIE